MTIDTQAKSELRRMYDGEAVNYGWSYNTPSGQYFMKRKIETMLKLAAFPRGSRILEVGCANGAYTFELVKFDFEMTGLDLSPECIRVATQKTEDDGISNISFTVGDAEELSQFEDNTFDGVISFSALRYVPNPDKAIKQIYRVVRPGGKAVVDFPNKKSPWFTLLKPIVMRETHIHDHQYTAAQIEQMMQSAGFQNISASRILYTHKRTPGWALPVMKAIDYIGEKTINEFASIVMTAGHKI